MGAVGPQVDQRPALAAIRCGQRVGRHGAEIGHKRLRHVVGHLSEALVVEGALELDRQPQEPGPPIGHLEVRPCVHVAPLKRDTVRRQAVLDELGEVVTVDDPCRRRQRPVPVGGRMPVDTTVEHVVRCVLARDAGTDRYGEAFGKLAGAGLQCGQIRRLIGREGALCRHPNHRQEYALQDASHHS